VEQKSIGKRSTASILCFHRPGKIWIWIHKEGNSWDFILLDSGTCPDIITRKMRSIGKGHHLLLLSREGQALLKIEDRGLSEWQFI